MKSGFIFCLWKFWIRMCPDWICSFENFESGRVRIYKFQCKNPNPDLAIKMKNSVKWSPDSFFAFENFESGRVRIELFPLKILNPDTSGLNFFLWKFWIRTRPDWIFSIENFESGRVRIEFFSLKFLNPDTSGFQFRTSYSILMLALVKPGF